MLLVNIAIVWLVWLASVGSVASAYCWFKARREGFGPIPGWLLGMIFLWPVLFPIFLMTKGERPGVLRLLLGNAILWGGTFVVCGLMTVRVIANSTKDDIDGFAHTLTASRLYRSWNHRVVIDALLASRYQSLFAKAWKGQDIPQALALWQTSVDYMKDAERQIDQNTDLRDPAVIKKKEALQERLGRLKRVEASLYVKAGLKEAGARSWQQAMDHFAHAIDSDPGNPQAYFARGSSYARQGMRDLAVQDFDRGCGLGEDVPSIVEKS